MKKRSWGDISVLEYGKGLRNCPEEPTDEYRFRVFGTNGPIGWAKEPLRNEPGIVVGRKGAYRGIHFSPDPFFVIDTAYYLRLTAPNVDLKWAYYKLLTVDMNRVDVGAAIPTTNRESFYAIPVSVPEESQQKKIASILSSYDALIENNRRRIQLLEQSARMLYKEWFVHLRFPGHEHVRIKKGVPEGWERKSLGSVAPLNYGKGLKEEQRIPGDFPVYGSSGVVGAHERPLVKGPGIIVGRKGNVGSTYWSDEDFYPIDTVYYIDSTKSTLYLYYALLHTTFISTDVAVPGLNRDLAHSRMILLPDKNTLDMFHESVSIFHEQMSTLSRSNESLAKARDILLPKLMSGEVEV